MANMPNAPLIYTLGVVRFPRVLAIGKFAGAFLDAVRNNYPQFDDITLSFLRANFSLGPDEKSEIDDRGELKLKMFQFASPDRKWAFLLTEEIFGLHTSAYLDHNDFLRRFEEGMKVLLSIPGLNLPWMEAIGFRYVDLVKPRDGEPVDNYLNQWVLPPKPDIQDEEMDLLQGMYIATYKTVLGELRFQSLRRPPITLPMDLNSPAIQKNGWVPPIPEGDFAVMDIDHGCRFSTLEPMDIRKVCDKLRGLRAISRKLFDRTGTEYGMKVWKGEASS